MVTSKSWFPYKAAFDKAAQWVCYFPRCASTRYCIYWTKGSGSPDWPLNENRDGDLCRQYNRVSDSSWRSSSNVWRNTDQRKATGTCLNIRKFKAIAAGPWDTEMNMMDTHYCTELTILGFSFTKTIVQSENTSWTRVSRKVRALARDGYDRNLWLTQRVQFFGRLGLVGCIAVEWYASMWDGVSAANHTSASTNSPPLPSSTKSDLMPSFWSCCCVICVLFLFSSVSFPCTTPQLG